MSTATRVDRNRHWVQRFKFVYDGTEIGKRSNAFAFEFVFPSNCLDDLAHNLSQPTQRMGLVKRDPIRRRRQEVAAFADQRLAHEVGHLLLGAQAHASRGLMRANWVRSDYVTMNQGQLHFTPEQARVLASRYGVSVAASKAVAAEKEPR